jgi:hypothetical protein
VTSGNHERSELTTSLKAWLKVFLLFLLFVCFQDLCGSRERFLLTCESRYIPTAKMTRGLYGGPRLLPLLSFFQVAFADYKALLFESHAHLVAGATDLQAHFTRFDLLMQAGTTKTVILRIQKSPCTPPPSTIPNSFALSFPAHSIFHITSYSSHTQVLLSGYEVSLLTTSPLIETSLSGSANYSSRRTPDVLSSATKPLRCTKQLVFLATPGKSIPNDVLNAGTQQGASTKTRCVQSSVDSTHLWHSCAPRRTRSHPERAVAVAICSFM